MQNFMQKFKKGFIGNRRSNKLALLCITVIVVVSAMMVPAFAEPTPTLDINFDVAEMFTWAQTIINAMLPVVYIIMGVALGFLIIRAFKAAFS